MHGGAWVDAHVLGRSDEDAFDFLKPDPGIERGYIALAKTLTDPTFDQAALSAFLGRTVSAAGRAENRGRHDPALCSNCGEVPARARTGRCERCRTYWRRHGRERPA